LHDNHFVPDASYFQRLKLGRAFGTTPPPTPMKMLRACTSNVRVQTIDILRVYIGVNSGYAFSTLTRKLTLLVKSGGPLFLKKINIYI
jgi:hypothetical protein